MNAKDLIRDGSIRRDVTFLEIERNGCVSTSDGERMLSVGGQVHTILAVNMYLSALQEISRLCKKIEEMENK